MGNKSHFFRQSNGLSLVADYKFNNNLIDDVGGNNGTGTNITFNSGSFGNEAVFNGSSSLVEIPDNDAFTFTDGVNDLPFRMELVVKISSLKNQSIISKRLNNNNEMQLACASNNLFQIALLNPPANNLIASSVIPPVSSNGYYNIVVDYDGSKTQNGLSIVVNGFSSTPDPSNPTYVGMTSTGTNITLGKDGYRNTGYLNGAISQIKVYK